MSVEYSCQKKHLHGASRSIVRKIGNSLPIDTGKRLYIQLPNQSHLQSPSIEVRYAATGERLSQDEDGLQFASYLNEPNQMIPKAASFFQLESITEMEEQEGTDYTELDDDAFFNDEVIVMKSLEGHKQGAMDKISALESELAKLKAQIAVYALAETKDLPMPPAPPPPPPPTFPLSTSTLYVQARSELVGPTTAGLASTGLRCNEVPSTPLKPAMADVLKDIGSIKLRATHAAKSPGGTPLRKRNIDTQEAVDNDPASIIALALKKKFAHKVFQDTPDKENLDRSDSSLSAEFDSPTVKLQFN